MHLNRITLLVLDIEEAKQFFINAFAFNLIEDCLVSENKQIVRIAANKNGTTISLVTPKIGDESLVGRQSGKRVFAFVDTKDLDIDIARFSEKNVAITDGPRHEDFGRCVLVRDIAGNTWEFVERQDI